MSKDDHVYLSDILTAARKIKKYSRDAKFQEFQKQDMLYDSIIRNLEIIGEATKRLSHSCKEEIPEVAWKKVAGFRDILIHQYSAVETEVVWNIITTELPKLEQAISKIIKKQPSS